MSVFKSKRRKGGKVRSSKAYYGEYTNAKTGTRVRVSLRTSDKQVAQIKLNQLILAQQKESVGLIAPEAVRDAAPRSVAEHLRDYKADLCSTGCSDKYIYNVGKRVEKLASECNWKTVGNIPADSFQDWRARQKIAAKTKNEYLDAISSMLNWMVQNGRLATNALRAVRKFRLLETQCGFVVRSRMRK